MCVVGTYVSHGCMSILLCALAVFMFVMFANNMYHMSLVLLSSPAPVIARNGT